MACRRFSADICEMKRLYVRPSGRGSGLARALVTTLLAAAARAGLPPDLPRHPAHHGRRAAHVRVAGLPRHRAVLRHPDPRHPVHGQSRCGPDSLSPRLARPVQLVLLMRRITRALALLLLALATATNGWGQGSGPAPSLTLLSREGRRALPITVINNQDYIAVDDLAGPFGTAAREAAGGLTITARGRTLILTADQNLVSAAGRLVSLPAPAVRRDNRWFVPARFPAAGARSGPRPPPRSSPAHAAAGDGRPARPAHRHAHRQRHRERRRSPSRSRR